jgi:hypothetical protein
MRRLRNRPRIYGVVAAPGGGRPAGAKGVIAVDAAGEQAMLGTILLIILILLLIGAVPSWPYSRGWGYGPSGILGVILIVVIILLLMGRL